MRTATALVLAILSAAGAPGPAAAQTRPPDLALASLEDLMNVEIVSASRKEQPLGETAAAVYVITREDIRRSGLTSVPELLRLVPGVQVAHIDANKWAVSVRGFNGRYSNKLLVLIDGRSVYNRLFSGVYWETEDVVLDEIERIEVVRGPGGSVWGRNAVNGVINIVTRTADKSRGGFVRLDLGTFDRVQGLARYGASIGPATSYRLYAQWSDRGNNRTDRDAPALDGFHNLTVGFRADSNVGPRSLLTIESSVTVGEAGSRLMLLDSPASPPGGTVPADAIARSRNVDLLARWTRTGATGSTLRLQSFVEVNRRDERSGDYHAATFDVEVQYRARAGLRHDVVAGGGYRRVDDRFAGTFALTVVPQSADSTLGTAYVQDEIAVSGNRAAVTLGSRLGHDEGGWSLQPTARVRWSITGRQHLWAAVSHALRTPSRTDVGMRINYASFPGAYGTPTVLSIVGNPTYKSEGLTGLELGYRAALGSVASLDVSSFFNRYSNLMTAEPVAPYFEAAPAPPHLVVATQLNNLLDADTHGGEVTLRASPFPRWRLEGTYSALHVSAHPAPTSRDRAAAVTDANAPGQQWTLRTSVLVGTRLNLDASVFHVGAIRRAGVAAYTRADARIEWTIRRNLSVAATGQNLLDRSHIEYTEPSNPGTAIPRGATCRLTWTF